jgi:hypothetical protein
VNDVIWLHATSYMPMVEQQDKEDGIKSDAEGGENKEFSSRG